MKDRSINSRKAWPAQLRLIAAIGTSLGALVSCGGGSGSDTTQPSGEPQQKELQLAASQPGDVVRYAQKRVQSNSSQTILEAGVQIPVNGAVPSPAPVGTTANLVNTPDASVQFSGTTVQENGVDEHDWIKTDGTQLFALQPGYYEIREGRSSFIPARLLAQQRLQDGSLTSAKTLDLPGQQALTGLHFAPQATRLGILSESFQRVTTSDPLPSPAIAPAAISSVSIAPYGKTQVNMRIVPATATGTLTITHDIKIDGSLIGSRQIGNYLYVVSQWSPNLARYYDVTPQGTTPNAARLNSMTAADLLPTLQLGNNAPEPLHAETDCYVQGANASPYVRLTSMTVFDLSTPNLTRSSKCFMGAAQALYMSTQSIYLSSSRNYAMPVGALVLRFDESASTDIHKFSVSGPSINYRASGEVKGHLGWDRDKASYRMSEYQGDLRVVTFTGSMGWVGPALTTAAAVPTVTASPATLSILRESAGGKLNLVGSLPNAQNTTPLGKPEEQVYAVKFVGARAYVVTFRRIDPLYVLDLSNPAAPKAVGELEMPGYSDYLFPIGDSLLLGVGQDASAAGQITGVKLALMNVTNPAQPTLLSSVVKGGISSVSALTYSPRGISLMQRNGSMRVALPIRIHTGLPGQNEPQSQGLHRFEIDTNVPPAQARLVDKPVFGQVQFPSGQGWSMAQGKRNVAYERSVLIEDDVIYFSSGEFARGSW